MNAPIIKTSRLFQWIFQMIHWVETYSNSRVSENIRFVCLLSPNSETRVEYIIINWNSFVKIIRRLSVLVLSFLLVAKRSFVLLQHTTQSVGKSFRGTVLVVGVKARSVMQLERAGRIQWPIPIWKDKELYNQFKRMMLEIIFVMVLT